MEQPRSDAPDDALRRLEQRLDRASDAAERLIAEAAAAAKSRIPPAGWQPPASAAGAGEERSDLELLTQVIQSVRDLIPPELERRLAAALRELLLAVRALIDWYLERSDRSPSSSSGQVQDIPIS